MTLRNFKVLGLMLCLANETRAANGAANIFESGNENWIAEGDADCAVPLFGVNLGNGSGGISIEDAVTGGVWYWVAPASYTGDQSGASGADFRFDLRQVISGGASQFVSDDVVIQGTAITIVASLPAVPPVNGTWQSYSLSLSTASDWRIGNRNGVLATQADIDAALADITKIRIRGEYQRGADTGSLDNVFFGVRPATEATFTSTSYFGLAVTASPGGLYRAGRTEDLSGFQVSEPMFFTTPEKVVVDLKFPDASTGFLRIGTLSSSPLTPATADQLLIADLPGGVHNLGAASPFESGNDTWTAIGDSTCVPSFFGENLGNGSGGIRIEDTATGGIWYWLAPPRYSGDQSGAYGNRLVFDLRQVISGSPDPISNNAADIVLKGGGVTLNYFALTDPPTNGSWARYSVTLDESDSWINEDTGVAPTATEFQTALADIESLRIRGEFQSGGDTGYLDNVVFGFDPADTIAETRSRLFTGVNYEGTIGGLYDIEYSEDGGSTWTIAETLFTDESPKLWVDIIAPAESSRVYRVVETP